MTDDTVRVPREPTLEMQEAMRKVSDEYPYKPVPDGSKLGYLQTTLLYRAMLSAAPQPSGDGCKDAERYRWLNAADNFVVYIQFPRKQEKEMLRLKCGKPLDDWIDKRIEEQTNAAAQAPEATDKPSGNCAGLGPAFAAPKPDAAE